MKCKIVYILEDKNNYIIVNGINQLHCLDQGFQYLDELGVTDAEIEVIEE